MINFRQNLYTEAYDFGQQQRRTDAAAQHAASGIYGIELRLKNVLVTDNGTPAVYPFPGYAKLYFLSMVACSHTSGCLQLSLKAFDQVDDCDALNLSKSIFYWKKERPNDVAPNQVHLFTSLIKSRQPLRDAASVLSEVQRDNSFKLLNSTLESLLKDATPVADISNLIFNLAGIAGKYLGKVDERPLLSWFQSFVNIQPDLDVLGKTERKAANHHAAFHLSMIVRDKVRMEEEALIEHSDRVNQITGQGLLAF